MSVVGGFSHLKHSSNKIGGDRWRQMLPRLISSNIHQLPNPAFYRALIVCSIIIIFRFIYRGQGDEYKLMSEYFNSLYTSKKNIRFLVDKASVTQVSMKVHKG